LKTTLLFVACVLVVGALCSGCPPAARSAVPDSVEPAEVGSDSASPVAAGPLRASGALQADEILVGGEVAGTVRWLGTDQGNEVAQGDELARLDTTLIDAQIQQAQAALQTAQAQLAKVKAGARPEEIAVADANVERAGQDVKSAEAAVEVAKGSVSSAQATLQGAQADLARLRAGANPQDIASAQERVKTAEDRLSPLGKMRDATGGSEEGGKVPAGSYEAARAVVAQAELTASIAELQAKILQAGARPQDIQAAQAAMEAAQAGVNAAQLRVTESEKRLEAARARVRQAQAQADLLRVGASAEQIALADAPVRSATAALRVLEIRRKQATLVAPGPGLVLERNVSVGEQVLPGAVLFRLGDVKELELTVYVPGVEIDRVRLGQPVKISVGAYPDRVFDGLVVYVSPQAEFSPDAMTSGSATSSEVYAITIRVPNSDRLLRPGMPAEAEFIE
jgi:multidrug resistance efflux pump